MQTNREATAPWGNPYDVHRNTLPRIVHRDAAELLAEFDRTFDTSRQAVADVRSAVLLSIIDGEPLERERIMADAHEASKVPGQCRVHRPSDTSHAPIVYYAQLANLVKIGTTTNLKQRMRVLNPERLLATEPGDVEVEHARHQHFADLHYHGEWYRHEGQLVAWINLLTVTGASPCVT